MNQHAARTSENGVLLRPASLEEAGLFYSEPDEEQDKSLGTVGHIRMDFGHNGKEFWHTWWPHNEDQLNTPEFKDELQTIVDTLRTDGPLKDLRSMRSFCAQNGGAITKDGRSFGYVVETDHYRYRPHGRWGSEILYRLSEAGKLQDGSGHLRGGRSATSGAGTEQLRTKYEYGGYVK